MTRNESWYRSLHRKTNKLERQVGSLPYAQEVESYIEILRGFQFKEGDRVTHEDNLYKVEESFTFSPSKKYRLSNEEKTIKVPEDEIIL